MLANITQFSQVVANAGKSMRVVNRIASDPFSSIASMAPAPADPPDCHIREIGVVNVPGQDEYTRKPKKAGTLLDVSSAPPASNAPATQPERPDFTGVMALQEAQRENRLTVVEEDVAQVKSRLQTIEQDVKTILGRLP